MLSHQIFIIFNYKIVAIAPQLLAITARCFVLFPNAIIEISKNGTITCATKTNNSVRPHHFVYVYVDVGVIYTTTKNNKINMAATEN